MKKFTETFVEFDTPFEDRFCHTRGHYTVDLPVRVAVLQEGEPETQTDLGVEDDAITVTGPNRGPNSMRLAACWNACEGIEDPSVVPELLVACKQAEQRLVELARKFPEHIQNGVTLRNLTAAIAKASGVKS